MQVKFSPQVNPQTTINYSFGKDAFTADVDGIVDSFDFSKVNEVNPQQIKTSLPFNPVVEVKRVNGELLLTLLNFIAEDAIYTEKFPEYMEV